jgi:uncharacterized protein
MDETDGSLVIEVCAVDGNGAHRQALRVPAGTTVAGALAASGLLPADGLMVALHGRRVPMDRVLQAGDRIELLGSLLVDPRLARQRRADKRRRESGDERWQRGQGARV